MTPAQRAARPAARSAPLLLLALLGVAVSAYLFSLHLHPGTGSFCDLNAKVSCDLVADSPYAEFFGVPVSLLGVFYWLGALLLSLAPPFLVRLVALGDGELYWQAVTGYHVFGALFSAYLTFIEAAVLKVWCPLCVVSALAVAASLAVAARRARRVKY